MLGARRDVATVSGLMTPDSRGRLLRALAAASDETGIFEIELVNFGAETRS